MSIVSESQRTEITARAGNCCEYCHLPTFGQVGRFPIDHVIPRNKDGPTDLTNLALACPHCNGRKWAHIEAVDPESMLVVPLFNPRTQVWSDHFQWSQQSPITLEGKTPTGRATITALGMNHDNMLQVRSLLLRFGIALEPGTPVRLE